MVRHQVRAEAGNLECGERRENFFGSVLQPSESEGVAASCSEFRPESRYRDCTLHEAALTQLGPAGWADRQVQKRHGAFEPLGSRRS